MELTPGERAVLGQIRDLYSSTSKREHSLATVTAQWPPIHYEAYKDVLKTLVHKRLFDAVGNGHALRITDEGLRAMGVSAPVDDSTKTIDLKPFPKRAEPPPRPASSSQAVRNEPAKASRGGRFGLLVVAAAALVLVAWLLMRN